MPGLVALGSDGTVQMPRRLELARIISSKRGTDDAALDAGTVITKICSAAFLRRARRSDL